MLFAFYTGENGGSQLNYTAETGVVLKVGEGCDPSRYLPHLQTVQIAVPSQESYWHLVYRGQGCC